MDTTRIVTSQGVRFNNRLYRSDALKAIVGLRVRLQEDRALVIWGDSVIEVRLWKRCNPSRIRSLLQAAGDSSAERPLKLRVFD
ncbi:Mu transposase C-terminal domain-containing protein [Pseudomonas savastanoi]|uniref:Mu transposase C-terminal domain-containing protein n=1 Tax=Pseudomonas savastanoi TaxID=29438 RepID=UPI0009E74F4E|nr:Mu transposase C-terminal domain-containing protein [Pseudomonas savastanoi]